MVKYWKPNFSLKYSKCRFWAIKWLNLMAIQKLQLHMSLAMELRWEKTFKGIWSLRCWFMWLSRRAPRAGKADFVNHQENYIRWKTETFTRYFSQRRPIIISKQFCFVIKVVAVIVVKPRAPRAREITMINHQQDHMRSIQLNYSYFGLITYLFNEETCLESPRRLV